MSSPFLAPHIIIGRRQKGAQELQYSWRDFCLFSLHSHLKGQQKKKKKCVCRNKNPTSLTPQSHNLTNMPVNTYLIWSLLLFISVKRVSELPDHITSLGLFNSISSMINEALPLLILTI